LDEITDNNQILTNNKHILTYTNVLKLSILF